MTTSTPLFALNAAAMTLALPLFLLYLITPPEAELAEGPWSYGAVFLVYITVWLSGRPQAIFNAFARFEIAKRSARYTLISVALFAAAGALAPMFPEFKKVILAAFCLSAIASFTYATSVVGEDNS